MALLAEGMEEKLTIVALCLGSSPGTCIMMMMVIEIMMMMIMSQGRSSSWSFSQTVRRGILRRQPQTSVRLLIKLSRRWDDHDHDHNDDDNDDDYNDDDDRAIARRVEREVGSLFKLVTMS